MHIKSLDDLKKDAKLLAAALKFAKRNHNDENLLFYFAKEGDPQSLYLKYLDRRASKLVNLPSEMSRPMDAMAKAGDWKNAAWAGRLKDAKESISGLWMTDCLPRFRQSDELWAYREPTVTKNMVKAAKLLGIKNTGLLMEAMKAVSMKNSKLALELLGKLAKKEALTDDNRALLKYLEKLEQERAKKSG